jgi:5-methylcytosine-specific restriction enzyme A
MPTRPKSSPLPFSRPTPAGPRAPAKPRPSAAKRGYGHRWRKYRLWFLRRHPVCVTPGCNAEATDVDHVDAVAGPDDPGFWREANHQALCGACHRRKTVRENGGFGRERK